MGKIFSPGSHVEHRWRYAEDCVYGPLNDSSTKYQRTIFDPKNHDSKKKTPKNPLKRTLSSVTGSFIKTTGESLKTCRRSVKPQTS
jgi:hypothetical protein